MLIVDDVADNREIYGEFLAALGYDVTVAENGQAALEVAARQELDVIVMDLALPILDGWEATRRLKADPRTTAIPVIALTGHVEPTFQARAIDAGCELVLTKPHLPGDLGEAIARLLRSK